jgi:hypothetical protein
VCAALLLFAPASLAQDGVLRGSDPQPNAETLKRLAQQLSGGNSQMPNIDPELMKLAAQYLEKNPDLLKDPKFQEQVKQYQQQAQQNPEQFKQFVQQQNPDFSPQQVENIKKQFQQSNPGGFQPSPALQPQPQPGNPQPPPATSKLPPVQPGQPQPQQPWQQPGQQNPFQQPGQNQFPQNQGPSAADKAKGKEGYQQVVGMWENNFGSIEKTPELKQSLIDMFSGEGKSPWDGQGNPNGGNSPFNGGNNPGQQKPWWDNGNNSNTGSQSGFISWLKNSTANGPPSWWKNMTNWQNSTPPPNAGSGWKAPQAPSGGVNAPSFGGDVGGAAVPVVILVGLVVAAVAAFLVWRYWPQIQAMRSKPKPVGGLGPWTIDPRDVVDRDTLVKAFEYLSVLICGDGARVWNHQTIADAFREHVPGAAPFADPLARLYALARYSPADEPIAPADIAEARGYLCRLAEVQE